MKNCTVVFNPKLCLSPKEMLKNLIVLYFSV
jgi:hypothetical protein